jgi:GNAT superfamily N-acetyltransferase
MSTIVRADLSRPEHAAALVTLLDAYAHDPAGGGEGLADEVKLKLPGALAARVGTHALIAFEDGEPAGIAIAFEGFSTFACAPLLNLHDFAVRPEFRGRGIAKALLEELARLGRELGCCKLTLEVLDKNIPARHLYRRCGFADYALDGAFGNAQFMQRWI